MSRSTAPSGTLRPAALVLAGLALATVAVVAIAAGPARPAGAPASIPPTPSASPSAPAPDPTAVPTPVVTPKPPAPVGTPKPPAPVSTPKPPVSEPSADPEEHPIKVRLDTFDGHRVSVDIVDRTGSIVRAVTGKPGDNPSADGLAVTNIDDRTLRLTWVDFPIDNQLTLFVDEVDGRLWFLLIQPPPTGTTDAVGMDRQLVLTFDHAVDAATVKTFIQEGMDT
jgi:hypothetical protein